MLEDDLLALPRDQAAKLASLTLRQVDYWSDHNIVRPSVDRRLSPQRSVRLYGFVELMSLLVVAELRHRGVSLQHVRRIVSYLRATGYPTPLTQIRFATDHANVYFQHPDGEWEGEARPGQEVIAQALDLEPLRVRIRAAVEREESTIGETERRRGVLASKPVVAGTRMPVETIRQYLDHGRSPEQIVSSFPSLTLQDVEAVRRDLSA